MTSRRIHIRQPEPGEVFLSQAEARIAKRQGIRAVGDRFVFVDTRRVPRQVVATPIARTRAEGGRHAL